MMTTPPTTRDRRRARRAHRQAARDLLRAGTLMNPTAPPGSTPWLVAKWHKRRARQI